MRRDVVRFPQSPHKSPRCPMAVGRIVVGALVWLTSTASSSAATPTLDVSQLAHAAWTLGDGFAKGAIHSIAQTPDGYLWLGTEFGLLRFDGVTATPGPSDHPIEAEVPALLTGRDGTLWIGMSGGLASWKDGHLTRYAEVEKGRSSLSSEIAKGRYGATAYSHRNSAGSLFGKGGWKASGEEAGSAQIFGRCTRTGGETCGSRNLRDCGSGIWVSRSSIRSRPIKPFKRWLRMQTVSCSSCRPDESTGWWAASFRRRTSCPARSDPP